MSEQFMLEDLAKSKLVPGDLSARPIDNMERAATNTPYSVQGYAIPYYHIDGKVSTFYRVRLQDFDPKYKQPKNVANQVYFPIKFLELATKSPYILITEGEKKATLAQKLGFPCVAFGGVDSWRNRIVSLPGDVELSNFKNKIQAKLPPQGSADEDLTSPLALGLQELIDFALQHRKVIVIVYDSDTPQGPNFQVQRAAAALAFELRFRGIPFVNLRQLILPSSPKADEKVGLDDFLVREGADKLKDLISQVLAKRSAFPQHPAIRDYINRRLQKPKLSRKEVQQVGIAILSDLDANGLRLNSPQEKQTYYFDYRTRRLLKADFNPTRAELTESPFSQYLYRQFGLSRDDDRLTTWLGAMFTGEDPVDKVSPFRVMARPEFHADEVNYQISDGQYVKVTHEGLSVYDNGDKGILFEADQVKPLNVQELVAEFKKMDSQATECWWANTLMDVRLQDKTKQRLAVALLFYITPWLHRWRGSQLPIEMFLGEPGTGKSSLCELRLDILTGYPQLRNAPQDLRDWHASVASTGGLHIVDNLQLSNKDLRQRLSDEMCRLVTEPEPSIEMRKLYTNTDLLRSPVRCAFGITAIQQPFMNSDIIQRSVIIRLDKVQDIEDGQITYNSYWKQQQLSRYGGREAWIAHHLFVLHKFFKLVKQKWKHNYPTKHRLINFEQSMILMAEVFGMKADWLPAYLNNMTESALSEADWALEGLKAYADEARSMGYLDKPFQSKMIAEWASLNEDFSGCDILINPRRVGRYISAHKSQLAVVCGLVEADRHNNQQRYKIVPLKDH